MNDRHSFKTQKRFLSNIAQSLRTIVRFLLVRRSMKLDGRYVARRQCEREMGGRTMCVCVRDSICPVSGCTTGNGDSKTVGQFSLIYCPPRCETPVETAQGTPYLLLLLLIKTLTHHCAYFKVNMK